VKRVPGVFISAYRKLANEKQMKSGLAGSQCVGDFCVPANEEPCDF
jgi:hypothetical protein